MTELEQLAAEIVQELDEPNDALIRKVLHTIGIERGRAHLEEARQLLANGGMRTNDGLRERTPGGVFLTLVRFGVDHNEHEKLFNKYSWPPQPPIPRLPWRDARAYALALLNYEKGALDAMQVKVIGKPSKVVKTESCMLLVMQGRPLPRLPRGIPQPPDVPQTVTCFVSFQHWEKAEGELGTKHNQLRIAGYPVFNAKQGMTFLLAESVDVVQKREAKGE